MTEKDDIRLNSALERFEAFTKEGINRLNVVMEETKKVQHEFKTAVYSHVQDREIFKEDALRQVSQAAKQPPRAPFLIWRFPSQKQVEL